MSLPFGIIVYCIHKNGTHDRHIVWTSGGSADQRTSGSAISGSADQRISGSADQRTSGPADQRISGSADQRIRQPHDHKSKMVVLGFIVGFARAHEVSKHVQTHKWWLFLDFLVCCSYLAGGCAYTKDVIWFTLAAFWYFRAWLKFQGWRPSTNRLVCYNMLHMCIIHTQTQSLQHTDIHKYVPIHTHTRTHTHAPEF